MENKQIEKPFTLEYANAKNKIVNAVNEAMHVNKIPCFLLESIISDILHQVEAGANEERGSAKAAYEKQLAEKENTGG